MKQDKLKKTVKALKKVNVKAQEKAAKQARRAKSKNLFTKAKIEKGSSAQSPFPKKKGKKEKKKKKGDKGKKQKAASDAVKAAKAAQEARAKKAKKAQKK